MLVWTDLCKEQEINDSSFLDTSCFHECRTDDKWVESLRWGMLDEGGATYRSIVEPLLKTP